MSEHVLLSLVVSPMIEDAIVDFLLAHEAVDGFTSYPVNGHGVSAHAMTPAEQVSGRQRQVEFKTYLGRDEVDGLMEGLKEDFSGSGIHYWVVPIVAVGRID